MRKSKVICCLLVVILCMNTFLGIQVQAKSVKLGKPSFKIKSINDGTGVKITINKTKGAEGYKIYVTRRVNKNSNYLHQNGEFTGDNDFYVLNYLGGDYVIDADGTKKRTLIIKGLLTGDYTFKVVAYKIEKNEYYSWAGETTQSVEKSISIRDGETIDRVERKYDFSNVKSGDIIEFGVYEQDDDMRNGKEPIEWIVLSREEDRLYLLSKYVLDKLPYDKYTFTLDDEYIYTESNVKYGSAIDWLNDVFYKEAFTDKERKMISQRLFKYSEYDDSKDKEVSKKKKLKVWLPTGSDMKNEEYGFDTNKTTEDIKRRCKPTDFAIAQGLGLSSYEALNPEECYYTEDGSLACDWWIIDDTFRGDEYVVSYRGSIQRVYLFDDGGDLCNNGCGIRPALYVKI